MEFEIANLERNFFDILHQFKGDFSILFYQTYRYARQLCYKITKKWNYKTSWVWRYWVCGMRILKMSLNLLTKLDLKWLFDLISETSAFEASLIIITRLKFSFWKKKIVNSGSYFEISYRNFQTLIQVQIYVSNNEIPNQLVLSKRKKISTVLNTSNTPINNPQNPRKKFVKFFYWRQRKIVLFRVNSLLLTYHWKKKLKNQ